MGPAVNLWGSLLQGGVTIIVAVIAGRFAFRQSTRVQEIASEQTAQGKLTDDLQEEVKELRTDQKDSNKEIKELRFQVRTLTDYVYTCVALMRRHDIEPPPVPAAVRFPWEEH